MVTEYQALVKSVVLSSRYYNGNDYSFDKDDLIQIGYMALLKAASTYKVGSDASFSTYASVCIKNAILKHLQKNKNNMSYNTRTVVDEFSLRKHLENRPQQEQDTQDIFLKNYDHKQFLTTWDAILQTAKPATKINLDMFYRHHVKQATLAELSEQFGFTKQQTSKRLYAGKKYLKKVYLSKVS